MAMPVFEVLGLTVSNRFADSAVNKPSYEHCMKLSLLLLVLQGTSANDIFSQFGRGKMGSMMALTQQLLATSGL